MTQNEKKKTKQKTKQTPNGLLRCSIRVHLKVK